ncbi:MAG: restriction endonuclease subunit S [Treponema sp.]|nr:restriction endonuclease subunit S [Treponema sp.]
MSNIPKLRFPEFSGEWEEKKLSDFMTRLTRKNSNNESSRTLTISSVDGLIDQGEFFKKQIASKDTSGYYLLKKGDFAYNKSYSVGYDYGSIKRLDRYEDGVVSTLYICMSLTSDTNSDYLTHYFDSMKWNKSVSEISAEGARNHGLLNIPTEAFFQTKHYLAPTLAEQQKIADFLSNVDSIITAETKILNTLQKKKKALMQKLFTRQLRFKSDDGKDFPAWEEKKLGECVEILDSQRKPIESKERANRKGEYPYYGASGIIDYIDDYLFEGESILLGEDGANIINRNSRLAFIATGKYWVNNHAHIMKTNADNLNHFICEYLESLDYSKICAGSAQPKLTQDVIRNLTIKAPCKEEQQKIADCLSSLDSLIQTQQKVVTTWQQRKKALLQQMFI